MTITKIDFKAWNLVLNISKKKKKGTFIHCILLKIFKNDKIFHLHNKCKLYTSRFLWQSKQHTTTVNNTLRELFPFNWILPNYLR